MSLSESARKRNGLEILDQLNLDVLSSHPQLLAGDLNAEPDDPLLRMLLPHLNDVGNCGFTFQAWNLTKRIDFVLARRLEAAGLQVLGAETFGYDCNSPETCASDHLGLRVKIGEKQAKDEL